MNRVAFNALAIDSNRYLIDEYVLHQLSTVGQITEEKELLQKIQPMRFFYMAG
ncbi:MAG: hypothetical protein IPG86_00205 [Chitinophagaceae bacterium]|nr:hypothetical protein [Chitinophagaceae bacterium]